ncbi:MAG: pantoate--beta-alanine ligase [Legionellaceae bacterium]|nr:pantoate--beta-alanine ligase [Legionellaceae bacterium]
MKIFDETLNSWRTMRATLPQNTSIGFVPTMGGLHTGHMALIQQSLNNNKTVVSLFVNPTQFNQTSDFENYPKTLEADIQKLEQAGVDYCLIPDQTEMYADNYRYQINENKDSLLLEGEHRPGHFTGVLTVVMKLFNLVKPTRAYFGEKDYQQLSLIKDMTDTFFLDIEICACPTVREPSQLALSSRNARLSAEGHKKAQTFAKIFHNANSCEQAVNELKKMNITIEYIKEHQGRRFAAIFIDNIRLIDNYAIR